MDALLIAPPEARYVRAFATTEYLGLGYLASYLEQHDLTVEVYNCNCRTAAKLEDVVKHVVETNPPLVGISVPTMPNLPGAVHLVTSLRDAGYEGHLTMGGHVATFQYQELLEHLRGIDSIVRGEGEQTLLELVRAVMDNVNWTSTSGLAWRVNESVICSPPRALLPNLDLLPFPRRILGGVPEKRATRIAELCSSRGCYGNCTFCSIFSFYDASPGRRFRVRSPENVVQELVELVHEQGVRTVMFVDDNFMGSGRAGRERVAAIAELILANGLDLALNISCRANDIDRETFALLKRAGLSRVFVGVESGVQTALDRYRKHVTVKQNLTALKTLNDLDIKWDMGFMIYDPDTTFEELRENVDFLRSNRLYHYKAATLLLNGMVVFPGTPVEKQLRDEGRLQRRLTDALEFMGTHRQATDYDQALEFVNETYTLLDPKATRMREMIDLAYQLLTPIYDVIWPLVTDWEKWLDIAVRSTGWDTKRILNSLGDTRSVYDALLHWQRQIGVLVMNLLEDMVSLVEMGKGLADFRNVLRSRFDNYLKGGHEAEFSRVIELAEDFLRRQSVNLEANGRDVSIPGAAAVDWRSVAIPQSVSKATRQPSIL